jgi:hypothetical protein
MSGMQDAPTQQGKRADPIGDLCPVCGSLLEPVGDVGEIVGYRVIETRVSTAHSTASRAVELIADRVGEIIARREFKHARIRPAIKRYDARSVSLQVHAARSRAPGTGERCRRRAPTTARAAASAVRLRSFRRRAPPALTAPPDESSRFGLGSAGAPRNGIDAEPRRRRHLRAWRQRDHHDRRVPGRQATDRYEPV